MELEKVLQDNLQHSAIGTMDNHLVEFTEELRTVAKALKRVADGKARAQEEAVEWKRKYELEKLRNLQLQEKEISVQEGIATDATQKWIDNSSHQAENGESIQNQNRKCCTKHGICGLEIRPRQISQCDFVMGSNLCSPKASFTLAWGSNGENNKHKHDVVSFESGNITTAARSHKQIMLKWDSPPQSVVILTKPNSNSVRVLCAEMIRWLADEKMVTIFVEPRVKKDLLAESMDFHFVQSWEKDEEILLLHTKADLVITLGGDGTVLWASSLFKGPVPPVISFSLGSLGFMTPFQSDCYRDCLEMIMRGPVSITLRHRLQCQVLRDAGSDEKWREEPILVLNEVTIDRGMSSFLTYLECYCDDSFVTCVQGDGLILSTTSGSTAYSLAAGGSMVHPQVPGILFTPICPHSLSFRPLILPEYVTVRVQVPFNSRGKAWASFDGKDRKELKPGDALICSMAPWPVPTACEDDSTHDFLRSVREGLHWNLRKPQSLDEPKDI
ncbi:hypothetical protein SUGI_0219500 [Cryptomeria japonica]|uniref:probable NAD kinase 1 n=1 Tax=Cryptomeria japonica TaxID=3369 RepID=UPI002408EEAF|nr:probable NAD kinase 1 [Cryptomeria japonica]XP_057858939.2 probable NAD kinase 1 [Cryptomeria japonica]XP_057858940.2 probable NAD kinase 1 [Cryptomeria japonica]XP_057858941.2 probable NAD kinase 1 [Cryptomeria japonica]GLJ13752.1 hypothetical protein SUGI_0219500 [Cryptomeria japonica]